MANGFNSWSTRTEVGGTEACCMGGGKGGGCTGDSAATSEMRASHERERRARRERRERRASCHVRREEREERRGIPSLSSPMGSSLKKLSTVGSSSSSIGSDPPASVAAVVALGAVAFGAVALGAAGWQGTATAGVTAADGVPAAEASTVVGGAADVFGTPICDHALETRQCQIEGRKRGGKETVARRGRVT